MKEFINTIKLALLFMGTALSCFALTPVSEAQEIPQAAETRSDGFVLDPEPVQERRLRSPFIDAVEEGRLDAFMLDHGIERSDRAASYFLFKGKDALSQGRAEEAVRLGEMAKKISPASPLPFFFLADAHRQLNPFRPLKALLHDLQGLVLTLKDASLLLTVLSPYFVLFLLSILFAFVVFVAYSLISYASIWFHEMNELAHFAVNPIAVASLLSLLLLAPLLLGLPVIWFFLFSFILFWRFYSSSEKGAVVIFFLGVGSAAWVLPTLLTLFTIKGSFLFDAMSRNSNADYHWVTPGVAVDDTRWEGHFIQASYEISQGDYKNAERSYLNALEIKADSPKIMNNLGNIAFYLKDYEQAIAYYKKVIALSSNPVTALYNLSQTYREMLLFGEGEAVYAEAKTISAKTVDAYSMKSARFPNYPVIEARFSNTDLLKLILTVDETSASMSEKIWQSWIGPIPLRFSPLFALFGLLILVASSRVLEVFFSGRPCAFCKRAVCKKCVKRLFSYQVCHQCQMEYKFIQTKKEFKIIEEAVKKVPIKLYPFFILPGGGHMAAQKTSIAFLFLVPFFLLVTSLLNWGRLLPPSEWYLHRSKSFLPAFFLFVLFGLSCFHLFNMRKRRIWL